MRQHYVTSSVHKCCETCEEPFYDLPRPKSVSCLRVVAAEPMNGLTILQQRVMYHENWASLNLCEGCGRRTLRWKAEARDEAATDGTFEEIIELTAYDDLETTVGGQY